MKFLRDIARAFRDNSPRFATEEAVKIATCWGDLVAIDSGYRAHRDRHGRPTPGMVSIYSERIATYESSVPKDVRERLQSHYQTLSPEALNSIKLELAEESNRRD